MLQPAPPPRQMPPVTDSTCRKSPRTRTALPAPAIGETLAVVSIALARLRSLAQPLNLAAFLAWLGVVASFVGENRAIAPGAESLVGVLLAAFLVAFVWPDLTSGDDASRVRPQRVSVALQAVFALGVCWFARTTTAPVLLVVVLSELAMLLSARALVVAAVAINVVLYGVLAFVWQASKPELIVLIYSGFECFAAVTAWYARRAETAAAQLRSVNAHLLATRSLLEESARDQERLRLSRELHDVVGHKLTALKLNLALLERDSDVDRKKALGTASQLAGELLGDVRGVVAQLRQHEGMDLRHAIHALVAPLPKPRIAVELGDDARAADVAQAEAVIRVAQEALTNIVRHAGATHATLRLARDGDALVLAIADDGVGSACLRAGNGLTGMRERVEGIGGTLDVSAAAGSGVRIEARIPD
jgi:signal transduction histidine kinase